MRLLLCTKHSVGFLLEELLGMGRVRRGYDVLLIGFMRFLELGDCLLALLQSR